MIEDWDDAYNNRDYCSNTDEIIERWHNSAGKFREEQAAAGRASLSQPYGPGKRNRLDRFLPERQVEGIVIFVHGGYWRAFDNSYFSHLATGLLSRGMAVYMPSYTLAPEVGIAGITQEIVSVVEFVAAEMDGPIILAGHSAGGHLVSRMACQDVSINPKARAQISRVVSLSGVHDLRPLINTAMNEDFKLDLQLAAEESPALCLPVTACQISCVVGSEERPEFLRQNALLANIWTGLGAEIDAITIPDRNHFTLIDDLVKSDSNVTNIICGT